MLINNYSDLINQLLDNYGIPASNRQYSRTAGGRINGLTIIRGGERIQVKKIGLSSNQENRIYEGLKRILVP